jgi:hypothetical protein
MLVILQLRKQVQKNQACFPPPVGGPLALSYLAGRGGDSGGQMKQGQMLCPGQLRRQTGGVTQFLVTAPLSGGQQVPLWY